MSIDKICLLAYLSQHPTQALGPSCGGHSLPHSPQTTHWLSALKHEELAPFNPNPTKYKVYRNVRDYGAKGDGVTDDSAAINLAISEGDRCGKGCGSATISPAIVYFPPGKYLIAHSLLQYYYTQFIGDPINLPELIMAPNFDGDNVHALIASDNYYEGGDTPYWPQTNNFYREIRNFVIDLTKGPLNKEATAIHWQVAQATSITNVHVKMSTQPGNNQQGLWMENGSGGYMSDLTFHGGKFGMWIGNQQFTTRNVVITEADTAVFMKWVWAWTFKGLTVENCKTAIDITSLTDKTKQQQIGSMLLMDSKIVNTSIGVLTVNTAASQPASAGTLILDNVELFNCPKAVARPDGTTVLDGGKVTIKSWGQGRFYDAQGHGEYREATLPAPAKPSVLLGPDGRFFERPKPQYTDVAVGDFEPI
ncbi:unnamed protein product [Medioppia subpectinata]|uniref:Rhamnogalacturonase A/B/Epimerase-like pectate lyase domain-containing protein n=1 Tax=Medioppia subpectinata TaxID=1979941 RepID=A0A7R9Q2C9_9ACAR|nr:unnamed protein product [Medioppia subpectinata]CAG2110156.1 unnamed protein product [Medioppia subpectinata]